MKFDRLKSSLELNSGTEPTIELAFRLADILYKDVAEEAGVSDIRDCPGGTKMNFLKTLLRQCNILDGICAEKKTEIGNYRTQIETYLARIGEVTKEIREVEDDTADFGDAEKAYREAEEKLERAKERKASFDRMQEKIGALEDEIAVLEKFDPAAAQAEIDRLTAKRDGLAGERDSFVRQVGELETRIGELTGEKNGLVEKIARLTQESAQLEDDIRQKYTEKETWRRKQEALEAENKKAIRKLDEIIQAYTEAKSRYDTLNSETIPQEKALLEARTKNVGTKEKELKDLVSDVGKLEESLEALKIQLQESGSRKTEFEKELAGLNADIVSRDEEIRELQKKVDELKGKNDEQRHEQLKKNLGEEQRKLNEWIVKCADLETAIAATSANVKAQESTYTKRMIDFEEKGETKAKYDRLLADIEEKIRAISGIVDTEEFRKTLKMNRERMRFLDEAYRKLTYSIENMAGYLNVKPGDGSDGELYRNLLKLELNELTQKVTQLHQSLSDAVQACQKKWKPEE